MRLWIAAGLVALAIAPPSLDWICSKKNADGTCAVCNASQGYNPDKVGACRLSSVLSCQHVDAGGVCLSCNAGFVPRGSYCIARNTQDKCEVYDSKDVCTRCASTHYLDENAKCVELVSPLSNCGLHRSPSMCERCKRGYILQNGACVSAVANCRVQSDYTCKSCLANTYPEVVFNVPTTSIDRFFWEDYFFGTTLGLSTTRRASPLRCVPHSDRNCAASTTRSACDTCKPGFYANTQKVCIAIAKDRLVTNCATYSDATTCSACRTGFYLSSGACVANPAMQLVQLCRTYSAPSVCSRCNTGYYFDGTACVPVANADVVTGCDVYTFRKQCRYCDLATAKKYGSAGTCLDLAVGQNLANCAMKDVTGCKQCNSGYYVTADKSCAVVLNAPVANCGVYSDPATCKECMAGYILVGAACVPVADTNCYSTQASGVCDACVNGYILTQGLCTASTAIANCKTMKTAGQCNMCNDNFYLNQAKTLCIAGPQAATVCVRYLNSTTCDVCGSDKYLKADTNVCTAASPAIANCYKYTSATTCAICKTQKALDANGACTATAVTDCDVAINTTKCVFCALSTTYRDITTSSCITPANPSADYTAFGAAKSADADCLHFYKSAGGTFMCEDCGADKYPNAMGVCTAYVASVTDCATHTATENMGIVIALTCTKCVTDKALSTATPPACASATAITDCDTYAVGGATCTYCKPGKIVNAAGASCATFAPIPDCQVYATLTTCARCVLGKEPAGDAKTCINSSPTPVVDNCGQYTKTGSTYTCDGCKPAFYSVAGTCVALGTPLPNCKYQNGPFACEVCAKGFYLAAGVCTAVTTTRTNCEEYSNASTCSACSAGYFLDATQTCVALTGIMGCNNYTSPTTCANCTGGYFLDGTSCTAANSVPGCDVYTSATVCAKCLPGKALNPTGTSCVDSCEAASATGCTQCAPGFVLTNNACVAPVTAIDSCRYYKADSSCAQCEVGFALSVDGGSCTPLLEGSGCANLVASTPACTVCECGYALTNGQCNASGPSPTAACQCFSSASQCEVCSLGYYSSGADGKCVYAFTRKASLAA